MKKYAILLICGFTLWLVFTYRTRLTNDRNAELVTHAYYGDLVEVKNLVEQGADLNYQFTFEDPQRQYTFQTFNALQAAASSGNEDVILFLLDQGMDIDAVTPDNWTPLFIAARDGRAEAAKLLVFKGADLNMQTNLGTIALTMVVTRGANPNVEDVYHHTPLYYAQTKGNHPAANLLQEYGAHL